MEKQARGRTPSSEVGPAILLKATEVVAGGSELTVREVAARAGVSPMSVYNHFGDKQGLLDAVAEEAFTQLRRALEEVTDDDPLARLRAAGVAFRDTAVRSPRIYQLMWESPGGEEATRTFRELIEIIRYGQVAGQIIDGPPAVLAGNIWACVRGAVAVQIRRKPESELGEGAPRFDYDMLLDMIVRGVSVHPD
ncbi:MAG: TetR/AcrR family transcriptional regulator [Propionibacterium sp.]